MAPASSVPMRLNVRARLLPMRILFTVCGALASMLRTQLRILLHVLVLVTSCAGWLAGLGWAGAGVRRCLRAAGLWIRMVGARR